MPTKPAMKQEPGKAPQFDIKPNDANPRMPSNAAWYAYRMTKIKGLKQRIVAEKMGISRAVLIMKVSRVERYLRSKNGIKAPPDIALERQKQYEMLSHAAIEALRAWEKSKKKKRKTRTKGSAIDPEYGEQTIDEQETTLEQTCGNPAYLAELRAALKDIRDMFGVNAPAQRNPNDPTNAGINIDGGVVVFIPHNNREPLPGYPTPNLEGTGGSHPDVVDVAQTNGKNNGSANGKH